MDLHFFFTICLEKRLNYSLITVFFFVSCTCSWYRSRTEEEGRKEGKEKDLGGKRSDSPSFPKFLDSSRSFFLVFSTRWFQKFLSIERRTSFLVGTETSVGHVLSIDTESTGSKVTPMTSNETNVGPKSYVSNGKDDARRSGTSTGTRKRKNSLSKSI